MSDTDVTLKINEIFFSIQGESLLAGKPTVFVRTAACNLRCTWCDTRHSYWEGALMPVKEIMTEVDKFGGEYVCLTGGEPLGQRGSVPLMHKLLEKGYTVSLETNGSFSIKDVPLKVIKVIDIKCPDSGENDSIAWENIDLAQKDDQFKFVVASRKDFDWAQRLIKEHDISKKAHILFSPVQGKVKPAELADWILKEKAPVTMQVQMHKQIWGDQKGV